MCLYNSGWSDTLPKYKYLPKNIRKCRRDLEGKDMTGTELYIYSVYLHANCYRVST